MGLLFHALEPRRLLSVNLSPAGELRIVATASDDKLGLALRGTTIRADLNAHVTTFPASSVTSISIDLGAGNDRLDIGGGIGAVYVLGGLGDDTINGGL